MDSIFKTKPFSQQLEAYNLSATKKFFALFMEMGTGKSKVIIDTAAKLYAEGEIDTVVVMAPSGVHVNWVLNEIPFHCPDYTDWGAAYYNATPRAAERDAWSDLFTHKGLKFFCFNIESASNKKGQKEIRKIIQSSRCMMVLDESHRIKTPGSKRTQFLVAVGVHAAYRRILTGSAITEGPLDFYAQLKFLSPTITGYTTAASFRAHFAEVIQVKNERASDAAGRAIFYDEIIGYRNIDELERMVSEHCYHITKDECLDLPPKVYERVYVTMTPQQRKLYNQLLEESVAWLSDKVSDVPAELLGAPKDQLMLYYAEDKMTAKNALTRILRLQQVLCGYFTHDEDKTVDMVDSNRMKVLLDTLEDITGKVIIWARYRADLAQIEDALRKEYGGESVVAYHGGVPKNDRPGHVKRFQEDDTCRFFVSQQHSGGIGLTLTAATYAIYYSNDYSMEARVQSEDRCHRIGQDNKVTYIDLVVRNSIDTKVLTALADKRETAESFNYKGAT